MTYCVGMHVDEGMVFMSDTRTNAGPADIAIVPKMKTWEVQGDRFLCLMSAGNLATTQAVNWRLGESEGSGSEGSILRVPTMAAAARLVGATLRDTIEEHAPASGQRADGLFKATLILGGQIGDAPPQIYLIYPEGNFIAACRDTPFMQIGEFKYGRPVLRALYDPSMTLEQAAKLVAVSFESTMRSNLSVGLPIDLQLYAKNSLVAGRRRRFGAGDPWFANVADMWPRSLRDAFDAIPDPVAA
jgi:putative proteasome-type protease